VKNKMAPPFKKAEFTIVYGEGISHPGELIDLGVEYGLVNKSGAWYAMDTQRIGQGRENAVQFLRDHPELMSQIESDLREKMDLPPTPEKPSPT